MRHLLAPLAFAAVLAAPVHAQAAASKTPTHVAADSARIGSYDLEIAMVDGTMTGELTITREPTGLSATVAAGQNRPAVKSFVRQGDEYVLTGGHGDFTVVYRFTFAQDSVKGSFKMSNGVEGRVIGALRR